MGTCLFSCGPLYRVCECRILDGYHRFHVRYGEGASVRVQIRRGPALLVVWDDHELPREGREDAFAAGPVREVVRALGQLDLLILEIARHGGRQQADTSSLEGQSAGKRWDDDSASARNGGAEEGVYIDEKRTARVQISRGWKS